MSQTKKQKLIIFTRYPEAGKTKTRMISALGKEGAAKLQRQMTEYTLKQAQLLKNITLEIHFSGGNQDLMKDWLGDKLIYQQQSSGDLGQRMYAAFANSFAQGFSEIIIIGIDCPDINPSLLEDAFSKLEKHDLLLGSATDGGYYLIGLSVLVAALFDNINWGTSTVLTQTVTIAEQLGLKIAYLPELQDVDYPEDLLIWEKRSKI